MSKIAQLIPSAQALLLRYIEVGSTGESTQESMRETGLSYTSYFRARKQLKALGIIDKKGNLSWPARRIESAPPPSPAIESKADEKPDYPTMLARGDIKPRTLAMKVDQMPWSGESQELMKVGSPAQKRKREQTYAIQAIIKYLLDADVSERQIKSMLTATDESAEDLYEIIVEVKQRVDAGTLKLTSPGGYLLKAAEGQRSKRPAASPRMVTVPQADDDDGPQPDPEFHDPVTEAKKKKIAALVKAGKLSTKLEGWE